MKVTVKRSGELLHNLAERAKSPKDLLKRFGGYLRAAAKEKIESGEGMAPWAESTRKKYEHTGTAKVTAQGRVRTSYARKLDQQLGRKGQHEVRSELRRILSGKRTDDSSSRVIRTLQRRIDRANKAISEGKAVNIGKRKSETRKLLGRLGSAFTVKLNGDTSVVVENIVGYSAVQNEGGQVGNGAVLPERRFLEITQRARQWMAQTTLDYLLRGE